MDERLKEDIQEIKDMMNRSTRLTTLSGLSGVSAGVTALAGAFLAWQYIFREQDYLAYDAVEIPEQKRVLLVLIAAGTLIIAAITAIFFTGRKTRSQKTSQYPTRRFLINLAIPMVTGGLVCLLLLNQGLAGLVPPLTLIFYGLALVNASRDTLRELRILGLIEIVTGLAALPLAAYGLLFWAAGFGLVHIIFGLVIQWKHKP